MAIDTTRLRRAVRQDREDARQEHAERLTRADLDEAVVVGIDASLSATGIVLIEHTEAALVMLDADTIRWKEGLDGPGPRADAGDALLVALVRNLEAWKRIHPGLEVVVEAPPTGHIKGKGTAESAIAANRVARDAALAAGVVLRPDMPIPTHKKLITGDRAAEKPEVKLCLGLLAQGLPISSYQTANDNVRDALCIAIADLYRRTHP